MDLRPIGKLDDDQVRAVERIALDPRVPVFMRPGTGKTAVTLTAILRLAARRTLVVAPAQVVKSRVWSREAAAWEHTSHLRVTELLGGPEQRRMDLILGGDIFVISYDNLLDLTDFLDPKYFDLIVYDELSKMKHAGTKRFKRMRAWTKNLSMRLGMTGSPLGNHYLDLWGEMFITAGARALGPTYGDYQSKFFVPIDEHSYGLKPGAKEEIKKLVRPYAFSVGGAQPNTVPRTRVVPLELEVPPEHRAREKQLRDELRVELDSGKTIFALNKSKLATTIRQFSSGAVYTGPDTNPQASWEALHDIKLEALENTIDELQGEPILVFVWFKHELERLTKRFGLEMMNGSTKMVDRWNEKKIPVMGLHPQGGGHGLNLQYGSSTGFWYTQPFSRELFDQANGRLARKGQPDKFTTAHVPLFGRSDKMVFSDLKRKGTDEADLITYLDLDATVDQACGLLQDL